MNRLISNSDYCAFLNDVATFNDEKGLWNPLMQDHFWGGIVREENADIRDGRWHYRVKDGYGNLPVTCVTWTAAIRYCNWLSCGQTEGDDRYGVYDTRNLEREEFIRGTMQIKRNTSSSYYLPTADEWRAWRFKDDGTRLSDNVYSDHWARPFPHLAPVNEDIRGNVAEWVETRCPGSHFFMALGGSVIRGKYSLAKDYREGDECNRAISTFGFRVFSQDEPQKLPCRVVCESSVKSENRSGEPIAGFCRIGYPGNRRDPLYKVGGVDYAFEMARCAVTNTEWCDFLNAVAADSDPHGLYNPDMGSGICGGIERAGSAAAESSKFVYRVKSGWEKRPVVYVGYADVCRYCNWLSSGDTERGSYDMTGDIPRRLKGAKYVVPTDDEWCKAAYYDPTRLGVRKYWDYPCRTDDLPANDSREPHACNYLKDGVVLGEKGPYYLSEVDAYPTSDTFFGCRQMAGNVWEWVEPVRSRKLNLRGSSFGYTEYGMGIWNRDEAGLSDELYVFGARIARLVEGHKAVHRPLGVRIKEWVSDHL